MHVITASMKYALVCIGTIVYISLYVCQYNCLCLGACMSVKLSGFWLSFLLHIEIVKLHNLIVCLKFALGCKPASE